MIASKLVLKENPTLKDFQAYAIELIKERGFEEETIAELFTLFLEECGELAKAARKSQNIKSDANSKVFQVSEEAADVFIYLLHLCNKLGVDLEQAFRDKEEINKQRTWQ
ncbi:hypothetical protein JXA59_01970 [Patescibacteria group bacterium]|nr:hypothetical protein [Patescibacteria group bacterium]